MKELRRHTGPVVRRIAERGELVLVTRWGRPCFVGVDWDTYCGLERVAAWSVEGEFSTEKFRRMMSSLVSEQMEWPKVVVVKYFPRGQFPLLEQVYKAVFFPAWMVKEGAMGLGGKELWEALSEVEEPDWVEGKVRRWKSSDFHLHISQAVMEAEKDLLVVERYGGVVVYVVPIGAALNLGLPFLVMADLEGQFLEEWGKASSSTVESLDAIRGASHLGPIRLPEPLSRDIRVEQVTVTELRGRWGEVLESKDGIYVVVRGAAPVCVVFPADLFIAIRRFVVGWVLDYRKGASCLRAFRRIRGWCKGIE